MAGAAPLQPGVAVVAHFRFLNIAPKRRWGEDHLKVDLTHGLVNFISGHTGIASSFQGSTSLLCSYAALSDPCNFKEYLDDMQQWCQEDTFNIIFRFRNHTQAAHDESPHDFRWVVRYFHRAFDQPGLFYSTEYRVYSYDDQTWSHARPMVCMIQHESTSVEIVANSPTQSFYTRPFA